MFSQKWIPRPTCRKTPSGGRRMAHRMRTTSLPVAVFGSDR
jgi:hypothetical protein